MCRILFLKGTNKKKALKYIDAFYKAGFDDPHLQNALQVFNLKKIKKSHIHGWGYLLVTKDIINTYLSGEAFYNDEDGFKNLKKQIKNIHGEFMLMAEIRLTDEGYVSALNSHPFFFSTHNGYEGWFFYNGLLDYEKLAKAEGFDYKNFVRKNGTTIMGHSFAKELENGQDIKTALLKPKYALSSGYNLMTFINNNKGDYKAYVYSFSKEEFLGKKEYIEYSKLLKREHKDLFFIGSNTISIYKKGKYQVMENDEFLEFDIDFINEYYFNAYDEGVDIKI